MTPPRNKAYSDVLVKEALMPEDGDETTSQLMRDISFLLDSDGNLKLFSFLLTDITLTKWTLNSIITHVSPSSAHDLSTETISLDN